MELLIVLIGLICLFTVVPAIALSGEGQKRARERNAEKKSKLQQIFSSTPIGTEFSSVSNRFRNCEAISAPNLVSEVILGNGIRRKVYIWYLDWEYVTSKSSGVGVMPIHTSTFNTGGNGMSFSNGTAMGFTNGQTTQKAFIQMVFENDKLIAKEQQGLYQ